MKKNQINKESNEIERLKKEHALSVQNMGKAHSKTLYIQNRLDMERDIENVCKQFSHADFLHTTSNFPQGVQNAIECKNVTKKYEEYHRALRYIASKIYRQDYNDTDMVAACSLFMYLIDIGYPRINGFKDKISRTIFDGIFAHSTGESLSNGGIDSEAGFFAFYLKLLNYGLDITADLEYASISMLSDRRVIEVVTVDDPKIIPYHLYVCNCKQFDKSLKLDEYRSANYEFWDFSESIEKVKGNVVKTVIEFWGIEKMLSKNGLEIFLNTITLQNLHSLVEKNLATEFANPKHPIIKLNGKYISVSKLLECILLKNEIQYTLNQDLLHENCYYFKIPYDDETIVKCSLHVMLNDDKTIKSMHDYISANAFDDIDIDEAVDTNPSQQMTTEVTNKMDKNYVPDSNYDLIMQIAERKAKQLQQQSNFEIEEATNFEEYENTTAVNMDQAKAEQERLKAETSSDEWKVDLNTDNNTSNSIPNIFDFNDDAPQRHSTSNITEELIDFDKEQDEFDSLYKNIQQDIKQNHNLDIDKFNFNEEQHASFEDEVSSLFSPPKLSSLKSENDKQNESINKITASDLDISPEDLIVHNTSSQKTTSASQNAINQTSNANQNNIVSSQTISKEIASKKITASDLDISSNDLIVNDKNSTQNTANLSTNNVDNLATSQFNNTGTMQNDAKNQQVNTSQPIHDNSLSTNSVDNSISNQPYTKQNNNSGHSVTQKADSIVVSSTLSKDDKENRSNDSRGQLQPAAINSQSPQVSEQTTIIVQQPADEQLQPVAKQLETVSKQLEAMTKQLQSMTTQVQKQNKSSKQSNLENAQLKAITKQLQTINSTLQKPQPKTKTTSKTSTTKTTTKTTSSSKKDRTTTTKTTTKGQTLNTVTPKIPPRKQAPIPKLPPRKKASN